MKKSRSKTQRLVHSPLVPAWNDEFDLRFYFSCIHPRQYELRKPSEYVMAKQLLGAVAAFGVCHVGIYRATIRTAPKSEVFKSVVTCTRTARRLGPSAYSVWYTEPQPGFSSGSPKAWFQARNQTELAELLQLKLYVQEADVLTEVPLECKSEEIAKRYAQQNKPHGKPGANASRTSELESLFLSLPQTLNSSVAQDEFDLQPYLARWSPANYSLGSQSNYRLAQELYNAMAGEFTGWIALYRAALVAAGQTDGVMEAVVRCAMKAVEVGLTHYLEWFHTPQAEFGALSPEQWFLKSDRTELCSLLQGSR
jgi:hypothetical protein